MQHLVKTVFKSGSLYSKQNFHFLTTIGADSIKVKIAEKKPSDRGNNEKKIRINDDERRQRERENSTSREKRKFLLIPSERAREIELN